MIGWLYMKKYLYLIILMVLIICCDTTPTSSESDEPEIPVKIENLIGTWNWTQSVDSTGKVVSVPTLNNTRSIIITQDFTFKEFLNDTIFFSDKFNLYMTVLPNTTDTLTIIDWRTSRRLNYIIFSLQSKTLIVGRSLGKSKDKYSRIN